MHCALFAAGVAGPAEDRIHVTHVGKSLLCWELTPHDVLRV